MPLNKTDGEVILELGPHYVVPVDDYSREPAFQEAKKHARAKLQDAGAWWPLEFGPDDVLAQVHPNAPGGPKLVFWFRGMCRGGILNKIEMSEERFVHYAFDIVTATHAAPKRTQ